ncbi:MAG TPA: hypothetical protein VGC53_07415 [Vicinamibacteria bacterium]|jgi:hypothetical protein
MPAKGRQISVRVLRETDAWLERRAGGRSNKADFLRGLIEREMAREREENLLEVFNKAAADVTESDRAEREELLGAFAAGEEEETQAKAKRRRRGAG